MDVIEVSVWSVLAEDASGSITLSTSVNTKLKDILFLYCTEKGIDPRFYALEKKGNVVVNLDNTLEEEGIKNGSLLILTNREDKQSAIIRRGWLIALIFLIIGFSGSIYVIYLFVAPAPFPLNHGIVVDAGSSHSLLFIFQWTDVKPRAETVKVLHKCLMPGGIAHYRNHIDKMNDYFSPCLQEAESVIPSEYWEKTRLVLGATAGMRILRKFHIKSAKAILDEVRVIFSKTPFNTSKSDVFILSGLQEGIDGWTAVNYLSDSFNDQNDDDDPYISALDLGGASVQLSTYVENPNEWHAVNVTLFNETYSVCSKSYLCYGVVKAHYRYEYFLVNARLNTSSSVVPSPCYPIGIKARFTKRDYHEPCIKSAENSFSNFTMESSIGWKEHKYIIKYGHSAMHNLTGLPNQILETELNNTLATQENEESATQEKDTSNNSTNVDIIQWWNSHVSGNASGSRKKAKDTLFTLPGTSDAVKCREMVQSIFDYDLCVKTFSFGDCMNSKRIPPYTGELVGFSSIFLRVLPLIGISSNSSLYSFEKAVMSTCSKNLTELQEIYDGIPVMFLEDLCFDVMYVYTLLSDGLSITPQKWDRIKFTGKVNDQNVEWTLGLILNQTSTTTINAIYQYININTFVLLMFLFSACILISLLYLFTMIQANGRDPYRKMFDDSDIFDRLHS